MKALVWAIGGALGVLGSISQAATPRIGVHCAYIENAKNDCSRFLEDSYLAAGSECRETLRFRPSLSEITMHPNGQTG